MNGLVSFNLCTLSNDELIKAVDSLTDDMFENQKLPLRHIPARPNQDYDLLIGEMIKRFAKLNEAYITVVEGYENDGMEQMGVRDNVFYKYCKDAINKLNQ